MLRDASGEATFTWIKGTINLSGRRFVTSDPLFSSCAWERLNQTKAVVVVVVVVVVGIGLKGFTASRNAFAE